MLLLNPVIIKGGETLKTSNQINIRENRFYEEIKDSR